VKLDFLYAVKKYQKLKKKKEKKKKKKKKKALLVAKNRGLQLNKAKKLSM
jgi:hypothetical protein